MNPKKNHTWRTIIGTALSAILLWSTATTTADIFDSRQWQDTAHPLPDFTALQPLLEKAGQTNRLVLLGEASHGTSEFYTFRTIISKQLITDHDFDFIVVEGDWESAGIINSYILDLPDRPDSAREALLRFDRWPLWIWANQEILELVTWLRDWNQQKPQAEKVGFYGMDVYGMWDSMDAVLDYFEQRHPEKSAQIEELYRSLKRHHGDGQSYARFLARGGRSSEQDTERVLDIISNLPEPESEEAATRRFRIEQNAWVVRYGEKHFRAMLTRGPASWNKRVEHMKKTVSRLLDHYGPESRGVVWAHNTHIGDARATAMSMGGQKNIGQLAREKWGREQVYAVGFGTHHGQVMAAEAWEAEPEIMTVPEAMTGSLEDLLAETFPENVLLLFNDLPENNPLARALGHRAIGVVYHPQREQPGNYVNTIVPERYDAFIFLRRTAPVKPLH